MTKSSPVTPDYAHQVIIFLFHLLVLIGPFFFTWVNEELFEFNKMILVYGFSILIGLAWLWRMLINKKLLWKRTSLDIPLAIFLVSQLISTLLSIHPRTSIFGYYTRFHGGLLSTISYLVLYYALVNNFDFKQLKRLLFSIFAGALGASLYALPEHFGHSPSCLLISGRFNVDCWVQKVQDRVFGTFGQPNWLAAYAVMLLPLGLAVFLENQISQAKDRFYQHLSLLTASASVTLLLALIYTKSRSGFLGLAVGLSLGVVGLIIWYLRDWRHKTVRSGASFRNFWLLGGLLGGIILWNGTPFTPGLAGWLKAPPSLTAPAAPTADQPPTNQPVANRLDEGGTDSGEIRKIVWSGAFEVWKRYPLFGSGVETFAYSYYRDRPLAHNLVSEWDFLYNKAHNELLNYLATTGVVGLASYLLIFFWFGLKVWRRLWKKDLGLHHQQEKILSLGLAAGLAALFVSNLLGFSTVMVTVLMYLYFAFWAILTQPQTPPAKKQLPIKPIKLEGWDYVGLSGSGIVAGLLLLQVFTIWRADYLFTRGSRLIDAGDLGQGAPLIQTAIELRPHEDLFYDKLGSTFGQAALFFAEQKKLPEAQAAAESALGMSSLALELNPVNLNIYKSRIRLLITLGALDEQLLIEAQKTTRAAMVLAPTDAKLVFNLGVITGVLGDTEGAINALRQAIAMKDNYIQARHYLADIYLENKQPTLALEQLRHILRYSPDDLDTRSQAASIEAQLR